MVVVYYTSTNFLDVIIETIKCIKDKVELHVLIEITQDSKSCTIVDVPTLDGLNDIEQCEKVLGAEKWSHLRGYFEGVASVAFVVHKHKRGFSADSFKVAFKAGKYIRKLKADVVHFDSLTARSIGLYPYIRSKKIFVAIHDPIPHSGEGSWKWKVPELVFFRATKGFFFYSAFARSQFIEHHRSNSVPKHVIRLYPYTYVAQFLGQEKLPFQPLLFFGRLSKYKGIDLLLEAIPKVLEKFPAEKFLIAGTTNYGYSIPGDVIERYKNNIIVIEKFLETRELVKYIESSKFVICPYRDATQSGVLMTSFAAGKMVLATNVGSFAEYILDEVNGLLTEPDAGSLANTIIEALKNEKYRELEKKLVTSYSTELGSIDQQTILNAYHGK